MTLCYYNLLCICCKLQ